MNDDRWAGLAGRFVDGHYGSLRGRVRTHVIDAHLRLHLPPPPAEVVDVGGGAGNQSIPLARSGYEVTIVDSSAAMLLRAEELLAAEPGEVRRRVTLVETDGVDAPRVLGARRYDAVLCHGVIMYIDDPEGFIGALVALARPGGLVSIVAKNAHTLAVRPALAGDWQQALEAFNATRQINGLDIDTRGDTVDGLSTLLIERGARPVAWYGVRLFTDAWTKEDQGPADPDDTVLAVELEASRRDPYRQLSRLFHLIAVVDDSAA